MINGEKIIEAEAEKYFEDKIINIVSRRPNDIFDEVFDTATRYKKEEHKIIFLSKFISLVQAWLQNHREQKHGGEASEDCPYEINGESFLFYANQEIESISNKVTKPITTKRFYWKGEPAELVELILAICELGHIQDHTGATVQKDIVAFFNEVLNTSVKNIYTNASAMKGRKLEKAIYLNKLLVAFENRLARLEAK